VGVGGLFLRRAEAFDSGRKADVKPSIATAKRRTGARAR
jgi:hypothetical protein